MSEPKSKTILKLIDKFIWLFITTLYLFISFTTHAWHITWIIFLVGALASLGAEIIYTIKHKKEL